MLAKLAAKKPPVTPKEIEECFANRATLYLRDTREEHESHPPTLWFIAETDSGRKLKIAFMPMGKDILIRSAYNPSAEDIAYYESCH